MAKEDQKYQPDGEQIEEESLFSRLVTLYAKDKIRIEGIPTFGYRKKRGIDMPIPFHYHRDRFEFHYLLQGSVSFVVDGQEYLLQNGDMFVTFPNEMHRTGSTNILRRLYWFTVEDTDRLLGLGPDWSRQLQQGLRGLHNRVIPVGSEMAVLLQDVFEHLTSDDNMDLLYASTQMSTALCKLIHYDKLYSKRTVSPEITAALAYMEQNKNRTLTLDEVAASSHLSLSYFKLKFKRETGMTPAFYMQKQRIETAKAMLRQGYSVTDAAFELGFCSSDYFSTVFRRITLMTPTQYVRSVREQATTK